MWVFASFMGPLAFSFMDFAWWGYIDEFSTDWEALDLRLCWTPPKHSEAVAVSLAKTQSRPRLIFSTLALPLFCESWLEFVPAQILQWNRLAFIALVADFAALTDSLHRRTRFLRRSYEYPWADILYVRSVTEQARYAAWKWRVGFENLEDVQCLSP